MKNRLLQKIEEIRMKYLLRMDADDTEEEPKKKFSPLSTRLPFGLCKTEGIDTEGMTPREAWAAWQEKTGRSIEEAKAERMTGGETPEEKERSERIRNSLSGLRGIKKYIETYERDKEFAQHDVRVYEERLNDAKRALKEEKEKLSDEYKDVDNGELENRTEAIRNELEEIEKWRYEHRRMPEGLSDEEQDEFIRARLEKKELKEKLENEYYGIYEELGDRRSVEWHEKNVRKRMGDLWEKKKALKVIENGAGTYEEDKKYYENGVNEYKQWAEKRDKAVLKKFKSVDNCKTSEDITDYVRAKGYFRGDKGVLSDVDVNLDAMDVSGAKSVVKNMEKVFQDYPKLVGELSGMDCKIFGYDNEDSYAYAIRDKVSFNYSYWRNWEEVKGKLERNSNDNWAPPETPAESVVDHEMAHAIEYEVNNRLYNNERKASDVVMQRVMERLGTGNGRDEDFYRGAVSEYSLRNRGAYSEDYGKNVEWLAECMREARTSSAPREIAVTAREEFEKLMREAGLL